MTTDRRTDALTVGYFLGTYSIRKSSQESVSGKSPDESLFKFGRGVDTYQPTSYRRGNVRVIDMTETSEFWRMTKDLHYWYFNTYYNEQYSKFEKSTNTST